MSSDVLSSALRQFHKSMRQKFDFLAENDAQSQIVLRLPQSYRTFIFQEYEKFKLRKQLHLGKMCAELIWKIAFLVCIWLVDAV